MNYISKILNLVANNLQSLISVDLYYSAFYSEEESTKIILSLDYAFIVLHYFYL